jgi:hypothetical protein
VEGLHVIDLAVVEIVAHQYPIRRPMLLDLLEAHMAGIAVVSRDQIANRLDKLVENKQVVEMLYHAHLKAAADKGAVYFPKGTTVRKRK